MQALPVRLSGVARWIINLISEKVRLSDHQICLLAILHFTEIVKPEYAVILRVRNVQVSRRGALVQNGRAAWIARGSRRYGKLTAFDQIDGVIRKVELPN